jgi:hypothetical protein
VRDERLAKRGIRVLRYSDREALLEPEAIEEAAWRALREIDRPAPSPQPSPPLGERENGFSDGLLD